MTASFLASFLIFVATGCYELFYARADFLYDQPVIRNFVYGILFLNACYYYYFAGYAEMQVASALRNATRSEWVIRVINQTILFGLWFLLHFSWEYFSVGFVTLYGTYLIWDVLTWKYFRNKFLVSLDVAGFAITILFFWVRSRIEEKGDGQMTVMFFFGAATILYAVIFILGICHCKFNPFSSKFLTRPELR